MLEDTRIYLSGPMDFVGSRVVEKYLGWRAIIRPILKTLGITVLDPWNKPAVKGHSDYGKEGVLPDKSQYLKDFWTNKETRAKFESDFWQTVHIDCRMVDIADSLIAFVPTNIYSVGTVHEIVLGRNQFKPVLLVSPPISYDYFPELSNLSPEAKQALKFYGLKENPEGIPSQWYGNIVGGNNIFDGFGWEGLKFKEDGFYEKLLMSIIETSKPHVQSGREYSVWMDVKRWLTEVKPFSNLKGSILDHMNFPSAEEERMLHKELENPSESQREYFWYNKPYTPKRPMLYQLFSIACGHIPTRTSVIPTLDNSGNVICQSFESIDDNWVIMAHDKK
jgi:hypothetical protein